MSYTIDVRREVAAFALLMEAKLRENDHKGGWKDEDTTYLSRRCGNELEELRKAVSALNDAYMRGPRPLGPRLGELKTAIHREAADVANFAMMLADVCRELPDPAVDDSCVATDKESLSVQEKP